MSDEACRCGTPESEHDSVDPPHSFTPHEPPPMTRVKATSEMDVETFRKHMNARHAPLGGLTVIGKSNIPGDENEDILRHYHDKAHELGLDSIGGGRTREINHYHSKTKETK